MFGEVVRGISALGHDGAPCRRVDHGAGRIGIAVASVGAPSKERETDAAIALGLQRVRCCERELLAATARRRLAGAETNGGLSTPQHAREPRVRILCARAIEET